jgi:hypothetical protein
MVDKKDVTPLGFPLPDDGSFSDIQNEFEDCYDSIFDSAYVALGRNIVIHLTPEKIVDTSGLQASTLALHYNPFQRRGGRQAPSPISTTRVPAVRLVHRNATYSAQIKHGPKDADDNGGVELLDGEVMTTTIIESLPHIQEAQSVTIDNRRYKREWTRKIGFRDVRHVITKWSVINEVENP